MQSAVRVAAALQLLNARSAGSTPGGMILTVLAACCFHWWGDLKLWWCVTAGVVLAVGSFFGDLTESALKRRCGIKDSGSYIPGMGGALDVLDSFIYNGILLIILTVVFYGKF